MFARQSLWDSNNIKCINVDPAIHLFCYTVTGDALLFQPLLTLELNSKRFLIGQWTKKQKILSKGIKVPKRYIKKLLQINEYYLFCGNGLSGLSGKWLNNASFQSAYINEFIKSYTLQNLHF